MCIHDAERRPIFCVVPPHMLDEIARNGTQRQREAALRTTSEDTTYRTLRGIRLAAPIAEATQATAVVVGGKQRTISETHNTEDLPGDVARTEGQPATGDPAVDEAYDGLGDTYDFYRGILGRNSLDGNGGPLNATVHYGQDYDNAFWDGQRMVFGDSSGEIFNRMTIDLAVIGHELTHGVTEVEAQLIYFRQSGALNESMSDVFGSLCKQYRLGRQAAADADWLIGEGLLAEGVQGQALRSMANPGTAYDDDVLGKDPQPGHMDDYDHSPRDNGGVHVNSGIPNKAFHLVATGIGGYAGERAGPIWYATLRDSRLRADATFVDFAQLTFVNAWNLFPQGQEPEIVKDAWHQVGIDI